METFSKNQTYKIISIVPVHDMEIRIRSEYNKAVEIFEGDPHHYRANRMAIIFPENFIYRLSK